MRLRPEIREAKPDDMPRLIEISGRAFSTDAHTQLKAAAQSPPVSAEEYMAQGMTEAFQMWLENANVKILVATVLGEGNPRQTIAGYIVFSHRNLDKPYDGTLISELMDDRPNAPKQSVRSSGTVEELAKTTDQSMKDWQGWFLSSDIPCMYIMNHCVDPSYQGRGIGPALLKEVTTRADGAKVPCWVQSSHGAWRIFKDCGFAECGRLQLNLDDWCLGFHGATLKEPWGEYVWRYMERMPT
ncbi:hypothetical protein CLAFUW4_08951 [Fulvia fulva]|nr:hypothetical protein CLAFUR4_08957 [Fulvia fulva]KAK4615098.1 hypothetical protein CLAFUR0_08949 [Fulvia fulva]WPV19840.1 hypothetical protein CLAFUW4_08951 [Fulvia fulva]WPV35279.1 hypothetical protein CLAFUW7_08952 [Fulvia fulva]